MRPARARARILRAATKSFAPLSDACQAFTSCKRLTFYKIICDDDYILITRAIFQRSNVPSFTIFLFLRSVLFQFPFIKNINLFWKNFINFFENIFMGYFTKVIIYFTTFYLLPLIGQIFFHDFEECF